VIQFVENCSYLISVSAALVCLADLQQHWRCGKISRKVSVVLCGTGNGKEWESPCVSGWLSLSCATETGLKREQGRKEATVTSTVPLAE